MRQFFKELCPLSVVGEEGLFMKPLCMCIGLKLNTLIVSLDGLSP
jgi:hypothetical protein